MQTFLPYPSYYESLACLDPKRQGNQIYREGLTLLRGKWRNHPASKMWRGHMGSLALYVQAGLDVLRDVGRCTVADRHQYEVHMWMEVYNDEASDPLWLGDQAFHDSHKSNLLRKNPEHYGKYNWNVPDALPYIWPKGEL